MIRFTTPRPVIGSVLSIAPGDVEAVVVNLIGRADFGAENLHSRYGFLRCSADERAQFRRAGEERAGFHADDPEIILARKFQVEAALCLDHFPRANLGRGPRDGATDVGVLKIGREVKGVREKDVAQQDAERVSPARVDRRLGTAAFRLVHDVVVHEGREMNQFHDHREIEVT